MSQSYDSLAAWKAEGQRRFGDDELDWAFACPSCRHVQTVRDYKEAGAPEGAVAFSCVGRYMTGAEGAAGEAFGGDQAPCNYAGGGLFRLNPVVVAGIDCNVFAFAEVAQ